MKIKKILFQRHYSGYVYRRVLVDDSEFGGNGNLEMVKCYTPDGHLIGNAKEARFLCVKRGLTYIQKRRPASSVCSIGYDSKKKRWAGWSQRAICSFGIGDRIFEERYGNEIRPFTKHGSKTIKTMEDAKLAASRFAASVS